MGQPVFGAPSSPAKSQTNVTAAATLSPAKSQTNVTDVVTLSPAQLQPNNEQNSASDAMAESVSTNGSVTPVSSQDVPNVTAPPNAFQPIHPETNTTAEVAKADDIGFTVTNQQPVQKIPLQSSITANHPYNRNVAANAAVASVPLSSASQLPYSSLQPHAPSSLHHQGPANPVYPQSALPYPHSTALPPTYPPHYPPHPEHYAAPHYPVNIPAPPPSELPLSFLLSESRSQNTELRIAVARMADQLSDVQSKMQHIQPGRGAESNAELLDT